MAWTLLVIAILFEVIGTTALKLSNGFTHIWWTIATVAGYVMAFTLLGIAIRTIPLGLAYAMWAGLGTVIVFLISIFLFKAGAQPIAWVGVGLVVIGIVFLNLGSSSHA